jgi:hypothetical protein
MKKSALPVLRVQKQLKKTFQKTVKMYLIPAKNLNHNKNFQDWLLVLYTGYSGTSKRTRSKNRREKVDWREDTKKKILLRIFF